MSTRQHYSPDFKREAVRLLEQGDCSAAELALQLGVRRNQLYKWQEALRTQGDAAFQGSGCQPQATQDEVARLRRELEQVKQERDILKKAAAYFAKELS